MSLKSRALTYIFLVCVIAGAAYADTGNSSSYRIAMQTDNVAGSGDSDNYNIAIDSGSTGFGESDDYHLYLGYASFGAKFDQIPYPPVVNLTSFAGESIVYQGTTTRFQITVKSLWNINSTIVPRLYIYDSSGALTFQRTGTSATLEAGATVSLLQYSTLVFSVGSATVGTYNATVNILFTDENNATHVTQNKSMLFEIRAVPTSTTTAPGGGGSVAPATPTTIGPVASDLPVEFVSAPALARITKGESHDDAASIINPTGKKVTLKLSVTGVPEGWVSLGFSTIPLSKIAPF